MHWLDFGTLLKYGRKMSNSPTHHSPERVSSPDSSEGGRKAWLTLLGSSLVYFVTFGFIKSFGFFQHYYQLHMLQTYPPAVIPFIRRVQIALMYFGDPVPGSLFDAYGHNVSTPIACPVPYSEF